MQRYFTQELTARIEKAGVIAVLVIERAEDGPTVARALLRGGIDVMELALRTENSLEALARIRREVPEMLAGVGTILRPDQVDAAVEAKAAFGVSPGLSEAVMTRALEKQFAFAPGLLTPSEIERALAFGCRSVKLFPAEPSGGIAYIKSVYAPYAHLGVRFIPLGGLKLGNLGDYLREPCILAAGGSWLAPQSAIQRQDWAAIERNAADARRKVAELRG